MTKKTSHKSVAMLWLPNAFNTYGRYRYENEWKDDIWKARASQNGNEPRFTDKKQEQEYWMGAEVFEKIQGLLFKGEMQAYMQSSVDTKDYERIPVAFWGHDPEPCIYENGVILGRLYSKQAKKDNSKKPRRQRIAHKVFIQEEEFEKALLIAPSENRKSNAGRKQTINYCRIVRILYAMYDADEHFKSQGKQAERILAIYDGVYGDNTAPSPARLKDQVLKELWTEDESIENFIRDNPLKG